VCDIRMNEICLALIKKGIEKIEDYYWSTAHKKFWFINICGFLKTMRVQKKRHILYDFNLWIRNFNILLIHNSLHI